MATDHAVPTAPLGLIQTLIGSAPCGHRVGSGGSGRPSEADVGSTSGGGNEVHGGSEALCGRRRLSGIDVEEDGGELVPADSCDDVPSAKHQRERRRDGTQHCVAGLVPELVVDALEMVDIDGENRKRLPRNRSEDAVKLAPVLQSGEPVGARKLCHAQRFIAKRALRVDAGDDAGRLGADLRDRLGGERLRARERVEEVRKHANDAGGRGERARDRRTYPERHGRGDLRRCPKLVEVRHHDQRPGRAHARNQGVEWPCSAVRRRIESVERGARKGVACPGVEASLLLARNEQLTEGCPEGEGGQRSG